MNQTMSNFARNRIKELLAKCTEGQQMMFKRMYSYGNLDADINDVVDAMPEGKLDHALSQCERTVGK